MNNSIKNHFGLKSYLLLVFALLLSSSTNVLVAQDGLAMQQLQADFPLLSSRYGKALPNQKAHYIFAIDVSSSMRSYESVVKENLLSFVAAVPNGDQITLIRMADENYTDFINSYKCITLDSGVRTALQSDVRSQAFRFLSDGDPNNGSDGFKTAELIVQALNTVGSNQLTFIYLFTDFEYWTHTYHYDKSKVDWESLQLKVPNSYREGMCKFGIELSTGQPLRQTAIFKNEMDQIFGNIYYQPASSAVILSQWFAHITADVLAAKMNAQLKQEWNELMDSVRIDTKIDGSDVASCVNLNNSQLSALITDYTMQVKRITPELKSAGLVPSIDGQLTTVGKVEVDKGFLPGFVEITPADDCLEVHYNSPFEQEIGLLQQKLGVSGQGSEVHWDYSYPLTNQTASFWKSFIPLWCWIVIAAIILAILASILYTMFGMKTTHLWTVRVKEDGLTVKSPAADYRATFIIGKNGEDWKIPSAGWTLTIKGKKYNPFFFWKKSGYYLNWSLGQVTVKDEYKEPVVGAMPGEDTFLCPLKGGKLFFIETGSFKIELAS